MGATNILSRARRRSRARKRPAAARTHSVEAGDGERTVETFEILHFAAWTPPERLMRALTVASAKSC